MLEGYAWLIPLLPLLAAGWIGIGYIGGWNRGEAGERQTAFFALIAAFGSLLFAATLAVRALLHGAPGQVHIGQWLQSGDYGINISLTLDKLGLSLTLLVALICLLTLRFSINYLHRELGFQRFFLALLLFMAGMELIVIAGNAALAFVGWELAGISSYLLIGFAFDRTTATTNATRAFVTNRIGDAGFLLGIGFSLFWLGGIEWPTINQNAPKLESFTAGLVAGGFLLAALVKSAQLPFSSWIARALEGPTPSSAIFYGSLMVHAGVYLLIRLEPLLLQAPALMILLVIIGLLTSLYGWLTGLAQTDVKSSLMFSTIAQVGLMFLWCGLGWFGLAAWHLALHAMWRTYQFLHAPALMHLVSRPARRAPVWLTRSRRLYTAALQRFWLDPLADWLLNNPTKALAREVKTFDERVVSRIVGLPAEASAISSLSQWEGRKHSYVNLAEGNLSHTRGLAGKIMERAATMLYWFEEHLVLKGSGEGLLTAIRHLVYYLNRIENLLSQPRYLLLLVMATFVVIL